MIRRLIIVCLLMHIWLGVTAEELVILHTNDTHSQIDPTDKNGGGVARRKVLIDSVRSVNEHVLLVDAGDVVQGTVYFNLFKGEPEQVLMNELGYDLRTIGNHEFDNGIEAMASMLKLSKSKFLSSNYEFANAMLDSLFAEYYIHEVEGRKVAFMALNIQPKGLVSPENCVGVTYHDVVERANEVAQKLKVEHGVDVIVALTHIGYDDDVKLASSSRYIDVIIGGHTHDLINPDDASCQLSHRVVNEVGDTVLIAQAGKSGCYLGVVTIDLDALSMRSKVMAVNSRLDDNRIDANVVAAISPYRNEVNALMNTQVATSKSLLEKDSTQLQNLVSDMVYCQAQKLCDGRVDLAIMNRGGIRNNIPQGTVSVGALMSVLPFNNHIVVLEIAGRDLLAAFDVMAGRGGDCVSANVEASIDATTHKCSQVKIEGKEIIPEKTYRLATIDYLAGGGDYMTPLTFSRQLVRGERVLYEEMIEYLTLNFAGVAIDPSCEVRMK